MAVADVVNHPILNSSETCSHCAWGVHKSNSSNPVSTASCLAYIPKNILILTLCTVDVMLLSSHVCLNWQPPDESNQRARVSDNEVLAQDGNWVVMFWLMQVWALYRLSLCRLMLLRFLAAVVSVFVAAIAAHRTTILDSMRTLHARCTPLNDDYQLCVCVEDEGRKIKRI